MSFWTLPLVFGASHHEWSQLESFLARMGWLQAKAGLEGLQRPRGLGFFVWTSQVLESAPESLEGLVCFLKMGHLQCWKDFFEEFGSCSNSCSIGKEANLARLSH